MKSDKITITGDIQAQLLGLTEQHIICLPQNTTQQKQSNIAIHQLMLPAFQSLKNQAKKSGIELTIASGFRSFERQLNIWNNKFIGKSVIKDITGKTVDIATLSTIEIIDAILLYSALPGASRHHWGCDIDVYASNLLTKEQSLQLEPWEYQRGGPMEKLSCWLEKNAAQFGFYYPYDQYRGGIAAEPWHLSYAPIALQYQNNFNLTALKQHLTQIELAGKAVIIDNLSDIYTTFINNINPCNVIST